MKAPRYFCDFCGKEVSGQAKFCPYCGHYFTAVRCPRCAYSASASKFKFGCPSCGYSSPEQGDRPAGDGQVPEGKRAKPRREAPEPLPAWTYLIAALLLIFSLGGLIMLFYK